jgi:hypothetical protein
MLCPRAKHLTRRCLPQRRSCNRVWNTLVHETHLQQGFNKPWVRKYSTRLNRRNRVKTTQECRLEGIKVRFQQESRFFCIKATNSEFLRSMFYLIINHQQNVSDSNLDHITHTTSFWFSDQSSIFLTTMLNRESNLLNQGAATIRTDYTQLGIPNHTTYVGL